MNHAETNWIRLFERMGRNLLCSAGYPTVATGIAEAMTSPESSFLDCLATAAFVLEWIIPAAVFCYAVSWGIYLGSDH